VFCTLLEYIELFVAQIRLFIQIWNRTHISPHYGWAFKLHRSLSLLNNFTQGNTQVPSGQSYERIECSFRESRKFRPDNFHSFRTVVKNPLRTHVHLTNRVEGSSTLTLVNEGLIHSMRIEPMQGALDNESRPHSSCLPFIYL
jgi:hypothetical protein